MRFALCVCALRAYSAWKGEESSAGRRRLCAESFLSNDALREIDSQRRIYAEALANAQVVFCTLSTAGSFLVRQMPPVGFLMIDEAAQARPAGDALTAVDGGGESAIVADAAGQTESDRVGEEVGVEAAGSGLPDDEAHIRVRVGEPFGHL